MAAEAPTVHLINEEYEAQFFRFLPSLVIEDLMRCIEDRMSSAVDEVERHLSKVPEVLMSESERQRGVQRIRSVTERETVKTLTKLKNHLVGEFLRLPPHFLLPCDTDHTNTAASQQQVAKLKDNFARLTADHNNEVHMQNLLRQELSRGKAVLALQSRELHSHLTDGVVACASNILQQHRSVEVCDTKLEEAMDKCQQHMGDVKEAMPRETANILSQEPSSEFRLELELYR